MSGLYINQCWIVISKVSSIYCKEFCHHWGCIVKTNVPMLLSVGKDGLIEEKLAPTCCHVVFPRTIYDGNRPLVCVVIGINYKTRVLISLWLCGDCDDEADDHLITETFQNQSMWNCDSRYAFPWVSTDLSNLTYDESIRLQFWTRLGNFFTWRVRRAVGW